MKSFIISMVLVVVAIASVIMFISSMELGWLMATVYSVAGLWIMNIIVNGEPECEVIVVVKEKEE